MNAPKTDPAKGSGESVRVPCRHCLERTLVLELKAGSHDLACHRCQAVTRVVIEKHGVDLVVRASVLRGP